MTNEDISQNPEKLRALALERGARIERLEGALRGLLDDLKNRAEMYRHHPRKDVRAHYSNPQGETVIPVSDGRLAKAEEALADDGAGGDMLSETIQRAKEATPPGNDACREELPVDTTYYAPDPLNKESLYLECKWQGNQQDIYLLKHGLVYLRKNDAGKAAKKMLPNVGYFVDQQTIDEPPANDAASRGGEKPPHERPRMEPKYSGVIGTSPHRDALDALEALEVVKSLINSPRCQITQKEWTGYRSLLDTIHQYFTAPPTVPEDVPATFVDWMVHEMPPGTQIGDPVWWAPRIWRQARRTIAQHSEDWYAEERAALMCLRFIAYKIGVEGYDEPGATLDSLKDAIISEAQHSEPENDDAG